MAFSPPNYNLPVGIFTGPWPVLLPRSTPMGNLRMGRGGIGVISTQSFNEEYFANQPQLLLPAGTDIRDLSCGLDADLVEVPLGTGRWYIVMGVDDIGKGFANESRCATIGKVYEGLDGPGSYAGLFWPIPIP